MGWEENARKFEHTTIQWNIVCSVAQGNIVRSVAQGNICFSNKIFLSFSQWFNVTVSNIILLIPSGPREQSMLESKRFIINDQVPIWVHAPDTDSKSVRIINQDCCLRFEIEL